jgi:hypothetical protein
MGTSGPHPIPAPDPLRSVGMREETSFDVLARLQRELSQRVQKSKQPKKDK